MATIEKRVIAEGYVTYRVKVRRKGHPPVTKTFDSLADARQWGRLIEAEMDRGVYVSRAEAESTLLRDALDRYSKEVTPSKRGAAQELKRIQQIRARPITEYSLAALQSKHMAKYRDDRLQEVGPSSVRKELALISHLYTIAQKEWGYGGLVNPVSGIKLPEPPAGRERRLEGDEEQRLLAECKRYTELTPIVILAIETAMRRGEIIGLLWENVNLVKRVARLPETKNGTPREVPLSERAVDTLRNLPRRIDGRVFGTTANFVTTAFDRITRAANIEDLTFHDLRHEATTRLAEKFDMHKLMKITGHKEARMVMRYYHPRAEDLAKILG